MLVEICATPSSLIVDQGKSSQKVLRPSPTLQGSLSWSSTSDEWNLHRRNPDRWSNPWKGSEVHRSSIKFMVFFLHSSFFYRANSQWLSWLCVCACVYDIYDIWPCCFRIWVSDRKVPPRAPGQIRVVCALSRICRKRAGEHRNNWRLFVYTSYI